MNISLDLHKSGDRLYKAGADIEYRPHLDGWRGIAILWVMAGHFFEGSALVRLGWAGVNCFFILSGYLITQRLFYYDRQETKKYFTNFYVRRVLRIFPLYYGCLFIFFVLLPLVYKGYFLHFDDLYRHQVWNWLYVSNWLLFLHGSSPNITLDFSWSLAVEEQFYLCWPFLFRYVKGKRLKAVMICLIMAGVLGRIMAAQPIRTYYSTMTACEPLLMGAFICIFQQEGKLSGYVKYLTPLILLSMGALTIIFWHSSEQWLTNTWLMRYGYSAIDILLASLFYRSFLSDRPGAVLRKMFSSSWLIWLGKYSYGIYIFHFVLFYTFILKAESKMADGGMNAGLAYWLSRAGGAVAVLIISYASYHLYEQFFLRLKKYFV